MDIKRDGRDCNGLKWNYCLEVGEVTKKRCFDFYQRLLYMSNWVGSKVTKEAGRKVCSRWDYDRCRCRCSGILDIVSWKIVSAVEKEEPICPFLTKLKTLVVVRAARARNRWGDYFAS